MNPMGKIIAQRLLEVVLEGELGFDYTFDQDRDKNRLLRARYVVNDSKMKAILLDINESHYIKSEESTNEEHYGDTVHVFKINEELMPRYDEEADYVKVCIYVKITWPDGKEPMFIISFHEDEE